mmetsp:Transcript_47957/g.154740  ORF Transcript_47957/g.154740 Transcript_47957/m.154740 type:complete len:243 (-) Transcript_47957:1006-1734(-)
MDPLPSLSKALKASSTDPKCCSAQLLKDKSSSDPFGSHSLSEMVPETSLSNILQAEPTFPVNLSLRHAFWNSAQLTMLSLSESSKLRQATKGCGNIMCTQVCSSTRACGSGRETSHSGGIHRSSHHRSGSEMKPHPYRSNDWYNTLLASLFQPSFFKTSASKPTFIFLSEAHLPLSAASSRASQTLGRSQTAAHEPNFSWAQDRNNASCSAPPGVSSSREMCSSPSWSMPLHKALKSTDKSR